MLLNSTAAQLFDGKGNALFPTVLLDWVEWEGPLLSEAEKSRRAGVLPPDGTTPAVGAGHLQRFAERAWRRPVKAEELAGYLKAYRSEREAGETATVAYQVALKGVLTAKDFLYVVEGDPVARERLNNWELASRLSYFLWSSMPDAGLVAAAKTGTLSGSLSKEVDRMLAHGKTTIDLVEIYCRVPQIFRAEVRKGDNREILLPWRRIAEMLKLSRPPCASTTSAAHLPGANGSAVARERKILAA